MELSDNECWALAQHHGLCTPMLDWTLSPFAALFFAFEEERCVDSKGVLSPPERRAVIAVSSSLINEKATNAAPAPQPYLPTKETSPRLVVQSGLFLKMPKGVNLEEYVRTNFKDESSSSNQHARSVMMKITIPNEDRLGCLKMLNKMNINRLSLFPDLDGACRYINSLWEIDFDTSLGHIGDIRA